MSQFLPFVMQNFVGRPIACSEAHGRMIAAALSGRLNISSLESATGRMDGRSMRDLAAMGRAQADISAGQVQRYNAAMGVPDQDPYTGLWAGKQFPQVGRIAIVQVSGTLTRTWGVGPYSGATGYDGIQTQIAAAMMDETVRGIWMMGNSPGGACDGLLDMMEFIRACSEHEGGKPIWFFAGDYAYSAAYILASACDVVIGPATVDVGSVGVITLWADMRGALDQEGIAVRIFRSVPEKARGYGGMEELPEDEAQKIQSTIEYMGDLYADRVAQYRGLQKSDILQTRGQVYMGPDAKAIGFVDLIMSETQAWSAFENYLA